MTRRALDRDWRGDTARLLIRLAIALRSGRRRAAQPRRDADRLSDHLLRDIGLSR